jgi:site-specific recombinase
MFKRFTSLLTYFFTEAKSGSCEWAAFIFTVSGISLIKVSLVLASTSLATFTG